MEKAKVLEVENAFVANRLVGKLKAADVVGNKYTLEESTIYGGKEKSIATWKSYKDAAKIRKENKD